MRIDDSVWVFGASAESEPRQYEMASVYRERREFFPTEAEALEAWAQNLDTAIVTHEQKAAALSLLAESARSKAAKLREGTPAQE